MPFKNLSSPHVRIFIYYILLPPGVSLMLHRILLQQRCSPQHDNGSRTLLFLVQNSDKNLSSIMWQCLANHSSSDSFVGHFEMRYGEVVIQGNSCGLLVRENMANVKCFWTAQEHWDLCEVRLIRWEGNLYNRLVKNVSDHESIRKPNIHVTGCNWDRRRLFATIYWLVANNWHGD